MNTELKKAYRYCRDLAREKAGNFYYSFVFLPPAKKRAIYALYAFCQIGDQMADEGIGGQGNDKITDLSFLREKLDACYRGEADSLLYLALNDTIRRFDLPRKLFSELIGGMESDLDFQGFDNFGELRDYCYKVASTVGLLCVEIFGYKDEAVKDYAVNLGIALQLTNIIRDVKEDKDNGRIYLPREDLAEFGYREDDLKSESENNQFYELMNFQYRRAVSFYDKADKILPGSELKSQIASEIMKRIYRELLEKIKRENFPVFRKRAALPASHKIRTALSASTKILAGRS
ncbi:MAG: squalene/phytoene synthase family protein [FCB group bacterium]|nr:squalene/phytoene synthase family protein [FCB group bacterium]